MNRYEIHLKDIERIAFGQAPPIFLVEVFVRTVVVYLLLLIIVRWLGKRMTGELTLMEMAIMLTLGAIVATPMQVPERGILIGAVLLLCALGFQRGISYLGYRSHKWENLTQGKPSLMVKDGVMQIDNMRNDRISREQISSQLRQKQIFNLGMVERIYLEASGAFSVYSFQDKRPGLPLFPEKDPVIIEQGQHMVQQTTGMLACINCGTVNASAQAHCSNCGKNNFTKAVL